MTLYIGVDFHPYEQSVAYADDRDGEMLLTHPGIGLINALALHHTLGDVRRFRRKEEVVAFVGLDPPWSGDCRTKRRSPARMKVTSFATAKRT